ncbi:MAG: hypothetical protein JW959_05960 [Pirellulales bacterium]|nr:hypothetical protein [Pirellulales bacterium]
MTRILALCLLAAAASQPAAERHSFRFHKDVILAQPGRESMVSVLFDSQVYAAARDGLPDVRLLDDTGRQTPFAIEKVVETIESEVRRPLPSRVFSPPSEQGDRVKVLLRLDGEARGADGLSVFTPLENFEYRVRVYGSDNGLTWLPLEENGRVFDYSRLMDISNRDVRLPKNEQRLYAVEIIGVGEVEQSLFREMTRKYHDKEEVERIEKTVLRRRPFRLERIEFWKDRKETLQRRDEKTDYYASIAKINEDLDERATKMLIDAKRQPITELTIETASRNFVRPAEVYVKTAAGRRAEMNCIARNKISLIEFGAFDRRSLTISFPEQRAKQYLVVIHNGDNQPLKITGVSAHGNVYRAVFLAKADRKYRLVYGSQIAERPDYDAAAVLAPLRAEGHRPIEAKLGQEVEDSPAGQPLSVDSVLNNPLLLGSAIVVLVLLLAWALCTAARRVDGLPRG